ncbi:hypothetical protein PUN28_000449 [Cardiocondyla obscurior]|uniref:Uncharacterized protein n=1 Tax=Cardiocondyla obscurior TaxID=286306 RepID=A0AAW2H014_9HYME
MSHRGRPSGTFVITAREAKAKKKKPALAFTRSKASTREHPVREVKAKHRGTSDRTSNNRLRPPTLAVALTSRLVPRTTHQAPPHDLGRMRAYATSASTLPLSLSLSLAFSLFLLFPPCSRMRDYA